MYLSRVMIDRNDRQKIQDLTHLGAYHNWVEQSFPNDANDPTRPRHLWRVDTLGEHEYLLVVSENKPDLAALAHYGVAQTAATKNYAPFLAKLAVGQRLQFRLTANPSYALPSPDGKRGRVVPHVTVAYQKEWLQKRAKANGFELPQVDGHDAFDIVSRDYVLLKRHSSRSVRLSRVSFEGELVITDLVAFIHALTQGIGREKAFGMGLMTVIPKAGQ